MKTIALLIVCTGLVGCGATAIKPGAETVRFTTTEPGTECEFLGDAIGSQGNTISGGVTSNENLVAGAQNDLKNRAHAMGGNTVLVLTDRGAFGGSPTNATLTGNVYRCPPKN